MTKAVVRIRGGLGNQLFCYAAARRLALANSAELVLDDVSGFVRDYTYRRSFALDHFNIHARKATPRERLEPCERVRRAIAKALGRLAPTGRARYIEQRGGGFDRTILQTRVCRDVYLDGLWQSELYFKDIEDVIREDLKIKLPEDAVNRAIARRIQGCSNAVAVHVRWFDGPDSAVQANNLPRDYYGRALAYVGRELPDAHFFIFSDRPEAVVSQLPLLDGRFTIVDANAGSKDAHLDLWLMSLCRHVVTANSTFSWWGAWLGPAGARLVVTPDPESLPLASSWRLPDLLPATWVRM